MSLYYFNVTVQNFLLFRSLRCKNCIILICIDAEVVLTDRCTVLVTTCFFWMQLTVCIPTINFELWNKLISETLFSFHKTERPGNQAASSFRHTQIFKKIKQLKKQRSEMRSEFLHAVTKAQQIKVEEEFSWAINQMAELSFGGRQLYVFLNSDSNQLIVSLLILTLRKIRLVPDLSNCSLRREYFYRSRVRFRNQIILCAARQCSSFQI